MKKMTNIKICAAIIFAFMAEAVASAAIPVQYYRPASGKREEALKTALHQIIYNHTEVSSYNALPDYFRRTDVYPPGNERYGQWWDMYAEIPLSSRIWSGLNREHSFPKSWWGGSTNTPAYVDLNHLYPAEAAANMAKSNYPLGEVQGTPKFDNGISRVGYPALGQGGGAAQVFEPADEYKGDFARTYFYMATCYQNLSWKYTYMVSNNLYPTLNPWSVQLLLKWHREDPVSQKEIDRNEQIYLIQANRNPFIDYPELAEYLWGTKKGLSWIPGTQEPTGEATLITPVQGMSLDFGQTAVGHTSTASLFFNGENLTGSLSISIYSGDYKMFQSSSSQISASLVNAESGYWLRINYTPTELGQHQARLLVSDGGIDGSLGIALRGEALPEPTLTALTATAASDITDTSYTANWETPSHRNPDGTVEEEVVDYYIVTRTLYDNGASGSEDLEAETNSLEITECTPGSRESYHVRSCRLGFESAVSNEIFVTLGNAGVEDVAADNPLGWSFIEGGVRIVCGAPHTGLRVYDATGRLYQTVGEISGRCELMLPQGAYIIVSDNQKEPLRVLIR